MDRHAPVDRHDPHDEPGRRIASTNAANETNRTLYDLDNNVIGAIDAIGNKGV